MSRIWGIIAVGAALTVSLPALADVKAGVDAWRQGDFEKAITLWKPLAQAGDPDAQFNLAQAYKLGRGVQPDLTVAADWYRRAAKQGHVRAEDNLGLLLFQQGDRAGAMPYLERASARGEPRAQYIVGTALFNGDMITKDWVRAYALMTRASQSGLTQATTSLEQMDKYIPADQRKQGLTMAANLEQQEKSAALANNDALPELPPVAAASSGVRRTQVPPSATVQPIPAKPTQVATVKPQPRATPRASTLPAPAASGDWRVQLGAYSVDGSARAQWKKLTARVSGLSSYQPYLVKAGSITRLQAGPLASSADASRLCRAVKAAGADCLPKKK